MKKIVSILLVFAICFSLCACGTVTIGPFDFHFDRNSSSGFFDVSSDSATAEDAAVEIAPVEEPEPMPLEPEGMYDEYGSFSFVMYDVYLGYFSERGYNRDFANEPTTPYIIVVFDYEELASYSDSYRTYSEYITIDGAGSFAPVDPNSNTNHFVNNIDRYFGFHNSYEHETLEPGTADIMFGCYPITEEAAAMVEAGAPVYIRVGESDIEHQGVVPIYLIDEILSVYNNFGYDYETAHATVTFRWSIDFAYYFVNRMLEYCEERGDTGNSDELFNAVNILTELYFRGGCASPAVTPNFDGEFHLHIGAPSFDPELVSKSDMYENYDLILEYMNVCAAFCEAVGGSGNLDEAREYRNILYELYYVLCDTAGMIPIY